MNEIESQSGLVDEAPHTEAAQCATDELVDAWFVEQFHNLPGVPSELFNRFSAARDVLKARLRGLTPKEA